MAQTQIAQMKNRHLQILEYVIANPSAKLKDVSEVFEVSIPWLSVIINSDCFQQLLAERHEEIFSECLVDINAKLTGLAHKALDKLDRELDLTQGIEAPQQIAELALKNMGYGGKATVNANGDVYMVDSAVLSKARKKIEGRTVEGIAVELSPSEGRAVGDADS